MSNWDEVEYIKNLTITVDGGQDSSTIYGNERNCAAVTVSFNGMNDEYDDPYLDLRDEDIGPHTHLVDFNNGKNLAWKKLVNEASGLFYSDSQGIFCNLPDDAASTNSGSIGEKRASVTFYVYGKCKIDMKRMIAVKIKLANGNELSSAKHDDDPHKIDLLIKNAIKYSASDLEPIKWEIAYEEGEAPKQWVAFVKLKSDFKTYWVDYKFEWYSNYQKDLVYVSRTIRKTDPINTAWCFFLCPLGKQSTSKVRLNMSSGSTTGVVVYNQEPGALCIARLMIRNIWFDTVESTTDEGYFKLYDTHGNLGEFKMIFDDPINPIVGTQNFNPLMD